MQVEGGVKTMLRLEALALMTVAALLYAHVSGDWKLFALLILAPDLTFAGYAFGPRVGAVAYNTVHSTIGPILLTGVALATGQTLALSIALIWFTHIGFDRALGYGLKYARGFTFTHLSAKTARA
jgi:Domain of unknown function (DUF4260)